MEPPGGTPPDRDKISTIVHQQPHINPTLVPLHTTLVGVSTTTTATNQQTNLDKLSRPMSFDKMEGLVREMQDPENGVPVRQQKIFLTSIPYAFMGYDLIEWLMDRLSIEESEALNIANQLCLHGYFFPVNDTKTLVVKDDSSLYRFQTPYYWPWQHKTPDNVEYAIYLAKRSLRNKQRHGLEDYETDALNSLHKNLKGKWDFISMQAEEQVRLAKERKKGDKIVCDSQERAYWRVHRPPPAQFTPLEPCPVPSRDRQGIKLKKKTIDDWKRDVDYLSKSLNRTRMKMSQACESLVSYCEIFSEYDYFLQQALPSNPWVTEDTTFWQLNSSIVEVPTEKRVKKWSISVEELVADATGLQEFTNFLEKEYSHENIRFWIAVNKLRRSAHSQVHRKVNEIYEEFLKPGAPCEINIDGKTMDIVQKGLKNPTRFTFDAAAEHIYTLLLKKDCYPRFVRSDHYKALLASGIQPLQKKRFFNFGGVAKKKTSTVQPPNQQGLLPATTSTAPPPGNLTKRRGSDRSLSGSAHELAVMMNSKENIHKVMHSHSQSNLSEIPYRGDMPNEGMEMNWKKPVISGMAEACAKKITQEVSKQLSEVFEPAAEANTVCPWEIKEPDEISGAGGGGGNSVCPWEDSSTSSDNLSKQSLNTSKKLTTPSQKLLSTSSEVAELTERMKRSCGLRQNTVDSEFNTKRLTPAYNEHRRSSMINTSRISEFHTESIKDIIVKPTTFLADSKVVELLPSNLEEEATDKTVSLQSSNSSLVEKQICVSGKKDDDKEKIQMTAERRKLSLSKPAPEKIIITSNLSLCEKDPKVIIPDTSDSAKKSSDNLHQSSTKEENIEIVEEEEESQQQPECSTVSFQLDNSEQQKNRLQLAIIPTPAAAKDEELEGGAESAEIYDCEISDDESTPIGCVAPAPTPAPSIAPLAEIEIDAVDDELMPEEQKLEAEETKKKRKKRPSDAKKSEEKTETKPTTEDDSRNAVCPWEDENVSTGDGTFTKTYATLGYL